MKQPNWYIEKQIETAIEENKYARIYLKWKLPLFGKFVKLNDHKELEAKRMIRFLPDKLVGEYNLFPNICLTRILLMEHIEDIKLFVKEDDGLAKIKNDITQLEKVINGEEETI